MNAGASGFAGPLAPASQDQEVVTVARTVDDFMRAAAIRAIVYMGGQECPHDEEFDGNDFCGMHLIGWVGGEPAASLRIRFFADFAKLERLAVRPAYRRSNIAFAVVRHGLAIVRRKGYRKVYGHARAGLEPFWQRFGARPMGVAGAFSFSGEAYTEMLLEQPRAADALTLGVDPLVLNRPEGAWDEPGVLERDVRNQAEMKKDSHPRAWPADAGAAWNIWMQGGGGSGFAEDGAVWDAPPAGNPPRSTLHDIHLFDGFRRKRKRPRLAAGPSGSRRYSQLQTRTRRITTVSSSTTCRTLRT